MLPNWHTDERGRRELAQIVDEIKQAGEGQDFDCIIGMSGGIDSSYLTYVAKEQLGLRPLVFHVDAGWNSQEAVNNIERWSTAWASISTPRSSTGRRCAICSWRSSSRGVPHIDTPQDHAFFATMYKFAEKHDIKYILTGAQLLDRVHPQPARVDVLRSPTRSRFATSTAGSARGR